MVMGIQAMISHAMMKIERKRNAKSMHKLQLCRMRFKYPNENENANVVLMPGRKVSGMYIMYFLQMLPMFTMSIQRSLLSHTQLCII